MSRTKRFRPLPPVGTKLYHQTRGLGSERNRVIEAEIVSDELTGERLVVIRGKTFPSMSAAAASVSGHQANGWRYWKSR